MGWRRCLCLFCLFWHSPHLIVHHQWEHSFIWRIWAQCPCFRSWQRRHCLLLGNDPHRRLWHCLNLPGAAAAVAAVAPAAAVTPAALARTLAASSLASTVATTALTTTMSTTAVAAPIAATSFASSLATSTKPAAATAAVA